jgi:hypothetical protein
MTANGMRPVVAMEGATTGAVFEAYVEMALAPALRPGQVVAMDNLGAHKSETIGQAIDAVSGRDARGWFAHRGYPLWDQLP